MMTLALGAASQASAFDALTFRVAGGGDTLERDLHGVSLAVAARGDDTLDAAEVLASARADYARLLGALYDNGYFAPVISIRVDGREASTLQPLDAPASITQIDIAIEPGPLYRFGRADVGPVARRTELPEGYRSGAPAGTTVIRNAAIAAVDGWRAEGHAKADVSGQSIIANHSSQTLNAEVQIAPGPVLRFGDLIVTGNDRTREGRVTKIAGVPKGEQFDPKTLSDAADRLRRTGTFRSVRLVEAEEPNADGTLDIGVELVEEKKRRFGFGAEVASNEGVTLSGFWLHRNLSGGAERLRFDFEVAGLLGDTGGVDYTLSAEGRRPATYGAATDLILDAEIFFLNEPEFTSRGLSFGAGLERRVRDDLTIGIGAKLAASTIEDTTGTTDYRHLYFPITATLDRRDGPLNSTDGFLADVEVAPFVGFNGSEAGTRLTGDFRIYEDLQTDGNTVLAARLQFGSILGASLTGLPNDQRFTSGGGGTVRGQDYQSLDVPLGTGRSGGRSFLGASFEVRQSVSDAISVVGFADVGIVGEDSVPGSGESHSGAGVGLRYDTGIGPIRVDLGVPVSGTPGGSAYHLYIGIGQAF